MKFAHFIRSDNFDEIYRWLQKDLVHEGSITSPRGMKTFELLNVSLVLTNPRDRLLYSNIRKHNYMYGAAEFLWYMSGTNQLDFIAHYLPRMADYSDDDKTVNSAYGYRIFGNHKDFPNQWKNVEHKLLADADTRQAVITVNYQHDLDKPTKDVPCTLNLHFLIRDNRLNMLVQMRSNDAYMGLIYDVFSFTLLQEHMFNFLKQTDQFERLELGTYVHRSDSMHLYDRDAGKINDLLDEHLEVKHDNLFLDDRQLGFLTMEEEFLRTKRIPITVERYSGACKFMAEKLNRILVK